MSYPTFDILELVKHKPEAAEALAGIVNSARSLAMATTEDEFMFFFGTTLSTIAQKLNHRSADDQSDFLKRLLVIADDGLAPANAVAEAIRTTKVQ